MMRRRRRENPLSLFSFQDIITGLCGIMIFMVLVQIIDLVCGRDVHGASAPIPVETKDERDALKKEVSRLEGELQAIKRKSASSVVAVQDKARPADAEKIKADLTEKELIVAALVSQVHDLETQVEAARKADAEDAAKVREMERTRRLLEQQIAGMQRCRGVTLIPERGEFKIPIYMVCSWAGIDIHRPFERKPRVRIGPDEIEAELNDFLGKLDHTTHSVVLLVRPSGVKCMNRAVELLKNHSFTYGRDPLEEHLEVAFEVREGK